MFDAVSHKKDLSKHAQKWADHIASKGTLQHSNDSNYGENIAMTSKSDPTGEEIVQMWYDEILKYNFKKPGFASGTGHFTQVVWKDTTHIGIGVARGNRGTFVVANYEPAGNITNQGYFDRNVLPARKSMATKPGDKKSSSKDSGKDGDRVETNTKTSVKEFTDPRGNTYIIHMLTTEVSEVAYKLTVGNYIEPCSVADKCTVIRQQTTPAQQIFIHLG